MDIVTLAAARKYADTKFLGFVPKGDYNAATEYKYGDWVNSNGGSYGYIYPAPATGVPLIETTHWQQIASIGGQDLVDSAVAARDAAQGYKDAAANSAAQLQAGIGSPAGKFANLAAVNAANPAHDRTYLTEDDWKIALWDEIAQAFVAGGVYQAASVAGDIARINTDIGNIAQWSNLYDRTNYKQGYYSLLGEYIPNGAFWCVRVDVKPNTKYAFSGSSIQTQAGCVFDSSGAFVGAIKDYSSVALTDADFTITTPSNASYLYVNTAKVEMFNHMVVEGDTLPAKYVHYGFLMGSYIDGALSITVKSDGTGDFNSIRDAVDFAHANKDGEANIYIYKGVYDVCSDFTSGEIENASYYPTRGFVGIEITDGINLIGVGSRSEIVLHGEIATSYAVANREAISTLNLCGNCRIENLTISSRYIRYAVHDDFAENVNATHTIKNCRILNYSNSTLTGRNHGYGLGTVSGLTVLIEDCGIEPSMIYHNNTSFSFADVVTLKNTSVEGELYVNNVNSGVSGQLNMLNSTCGYMYYMSNGQSQTIALVGTGDAKYPITYDANTVINLGCVEPLANGGGASVGICVVRRDLSTSTKASENGMIYGIVIEIDGYGRTVVQKHGYVNSTKLGPTDTTGWAAGNYLAVGSNFYLQKTLTKENAVAQVDFDIDGVFYVRLL